MRQITKEATLAFWYGGKFSRDNTIVKDKMMLLHGNMIAYVEGDNLVISSRGWLTTTTKERLNGVLYRLNMYIKQTKGVWRVYDARGDSYPFVDGMSINLDNL